MSQLPVLRAQALAERPAAAVRAVRSLADVRARRAALLLGSLALASTAVALLVVGLAFAVTR